MKREHPVAQLTRWKHLVAFVGPGSSHLLDLTCRRAKEPHAAALVVVALSLDGGRGRPHVGSRLGTLSPCIKLLTSSLYHLNRGSSC